MNIQFKKGVLELCVLSMLKDGDKYGYELADAIGSHIEISEGTMYPLLRRLKNEGYFEDYLVESAVGPARKYYRLTDKGRQTQSELEREWRVFSGKVDDLIGGDEK